MTEKSRGRIIASAAAGLATLLLTLVPSALLVAIIALGALGEAEFARLGPVAVLGFVTIALGSAYLVNRWLQRAWSEPSRRPADVWIAFAVALTILLVGVVLIPVLIVLITVDSDHGLSDRELLVDVLWFSGHLGLAAVAYFAARALFYTKRPDALASE